MNLRIARVKRERRQPCYARVSFKPLCKREFVARSRGDGSKLHRAFCAPQLAISSGATSLGLPGWDVSPYSYTNSP